jgi:hypothetical protein
MNRKAPFLPLTTPIVGGKAVVNALSSLGHYQLPPLQLIPRILVQSKIIPSRHRKFHGHQGLTPLGVRTNGPTLARGIENLVPSCALRMAGDNGNQCRFSCQR